MLYASFCSAEGIYDSAFNRLAAYVTGGTFCHSQFIFEWNPTEVAKILTHKGFHKLRRESRASREPVGEPMYVCVDISWGGSVQFRILYSDALDPYYGVPQKNKVPIVCTFEQEVQLANWLQMQQGKSYDRIGALLCWLPWRGKRLECERYFCSQLMACGLEQVGILKFYNTGAITPNNLFDVLTPLATPLAVATRDGVH